MINKQSLPVKTKKVPIGIQSNSFLKLHRLKNPVHEHDRENAISISK